MSALGFVNRGLDTVVMPPLGMSLAETPVNPAGSAYRPARPAR